MVSTEQFFNHQRQVITSQSKKKKFIIYPNQQEAAFECIQHFEDKKPIVLLVALPGTGKTGTLLKILKTLSTDTNDDKCVNTNNIHIISGMNDKDWKTQLKQKILPVFQDNINYRSLLHKNTKIY